MGRAGAGIAPTTPQNAPRGAIGGGGHPPPTLGRHVAHRADPDSLRRLCLLPDLDRWGALAALALGRTPATGRRWACIVAVAGDDAGERWRVLRELGGVGGGG